MLRNWTAPGYGPEGQGRRIWNGCAQAGGPGGAGVGHPVMAS